MRSSREAITVRGYSPLRSPRLARNARKVRCPGFELGKIGGQLVLSELRLVSRYYETRGSESTVAAWSAENNLTHGEKMSVRACNLHSLFDGKCSVYKYRTALIWRVRTRAVLFVWQLKVSSINSLRLQSISFYQLSMPQC